MPHIVDIYTESVYENLKPLYANWEPTKPVALGDFGLVKGRAFLTLGNVSSRGIAIDQRSDVRRDQKYFASEGNTEVAFHGKGSVPVSGVINAKATLEVKFSSEKAVFFNAADCAYSMIADKVALGGAVMQQFEAGKWEREWAIVTDLITAGSTTIAVSGSGSGSLTLEAQGNVPQIDL